MDSLEKIVEEMKRVAQDCLEKPGTNHVRREAIIEWASRLEALQAD